MKVNNHHYCEKVDIDQNLIFFLKKNMKHHHIQFILGFEGGLVLAVSNWIWPALAAANIIVL